MKEILCFLIVFICCFGSCKPENNKIKNGIETVEDGLHIEEAYLTNNEQVAINDDNKVRPGDRVCLRLVIDGWAEKNGKVFLDASQTTATSSGTTLAINPSALGPVYTGGADPKDAKYVLLYQKIGKLDNPKEHIVITFKIWDKTTNKSVFGLYKLYM
jgi:hypothetical protein